MNILAIPCMPSLQTHPDQIRALKIPWRACSPMALSLTTSLRCTCEAVVIQVVPCFSFSLPAPSLLLIVLFWQTFSESIKHGGKMTSQLGFLQGCGFQYRSTALPVCVATPAAFRHRAGSQSDSNFPLLLLKLQWAISSMYLVFIR